MAIKAHYPSILPFMLAFIIVNLIFQVQHHKTAENATSSVTASLPKRADRFVTYEAWVEAVQGSQGLNATNEIITTGLFKRIEGPELETFKKYLDQGDALMCLMQTDSAEEAKEYYVNHMSGTDKVAAQFEAKGQVTDIKDLGRLGWTVRRKGKPSDDPLEDLTTFLKAFKVTKDYKDFLLRYTFTNPREGTSEWQHKGTGVVEQFTYNPRQGGIIITDVANPAWHAEKVEETLDFELSALHKISDLMFIGWQHTCSKEGSGRDKSYSRKGLEWILVDSIREPHTKWIISLLLAHAKRNPPVPGKFPEMNKAAFDTEGGAVTALMGSPLGRIVAWFLAQHKEQLGNKIVYEIIVFMDDDWNGKVGDFSDEAGSYVAPVEPSHMVFKIADAADFEGAAGHA